MVIEQELNKAFQDLVLNHSTYVVVGGTEIFAHFLNKGDSISLETSIYSGGNYIPTSVRNCIKTFPPFSSPFINTTMRVDEEKFEIILVYSGETKNLNIEKLKILLEEFAWLAGEWRLLLDEQDRNDRVRIYVK